MSNFLDNEAPKFIGEVRQRLSESIRHETNDYSYVSGLAGQMLALTCLSDEDQLEVDAMEEGMHRCLSSLSTQEMTLFSGAPGILFSALEMERILQLGVAEDAASDYDEYAIDCLKSEQNLPYHFDLISGISGLIVYANYRAKQGGNKELLHLSVDRLKKMSTDDNDSTHWFTPAAWIRGFFMGDANPLGCIDLGMAHGQPGPIATLALVVASGEDTRASTVDLLTRSLKALAKHNIESEAGHFPASVGGHKSPRCAWCYGDLGPVSAFRLAAVALNNPLYDNWADTILHSLAKQDVHSLGFNDAGMCHGTVGSSWILHQQGRQNQNLISRIQTLHDLQGHFSILNSLNDPQCDLGILEGLSGIALAISELRGERLKLHWALPFLAGTEALKND